LVVQGGERAEHGDYLGVDLAAEQELALRAGARLLSGGRACP
jgi:hypothetical protein